MPLKVPPKKSSREVKALGAVGLPVHAFVPALVVFDDAAHCNVLLHAAPGGVAAVAGEAVRENLIHDAAAEPRGGGEAALVDRQAEAVAASAHELAEAPGVARAEPELADGERQPEAVPERGWAPRGP